MNGPALVYPLAEEARTRAESAGWASFASPTDDAELYRGWLTLLCLRVEHVRGALLLLGEGEQGPFTVSAVWPDSEREMQYLGPTAEQALVQRRGIVLGAQGDGASDHDSGSHVGYPIEVAGRLHGAVVLDIGPGPQVDLQRSLREIHWGIAWLHDHFRQRELAEKTADLDRVSLVSNVLATAVQDARLLPSALAVANELAGRFSCDRVSIGLERDGNVVPIALSHAASFDARSDAVRLLGDAMDEVLDLEVAVTHPAGAGGEPEAIAHAEVARTLKVQSLCSVPLMDDTQVIGALTFERAVGPDFDAAAIDLCRTLGLALGPVFALKQRDERGLLRRLRERGDEALVALIGPHHPGVKLLVGVGLALLVLSSVIEADYRVSARTVIEGSAELAIMSPFEGYLAESFVRAGDTVENGQPLCRLDDRDLKLEKARWTAERDQLQHRFRVALAAQDRGAMGVISAQIDQAQAQLSLVDERLARATLVAPFDGVVVSGDLSQLLGSPVEQGKLLFEVAPLGGYRVILQTDERDIADLAVGQPGELVLSGLPGENMRFEVRQLTSVSIAEDGRNYFRVEAQVDDPSPRLRLGMEGVGKVEVGERRLIWIWTHGLVDWARLATWNWLP